jgi:hypothetical protein
MSALAAVIEAHSKNGMVIATGYAVSESFKDGSRLGVTSLEMRLDASLRQMFRRIARAAASDR